MKENKLLSTKNVVLMGMFGALAGVLMIFEIPLPFIAPSFYGLDLSEVPILVVSARGQEREKVEALDLGADDYVTKPFHINELLARVRVALRKKTPRVVKEKVFVLDGLRVDFEKYKVYVEDREVHLTPIEFKLLVLLIEHAGKVLTHSFIIRNIWGYSSCEDSQSLRVFMANIRRKIEKDSSHPRYILTEVGVGYRFVDE